MNICSIIGCNKTGYDGYLKRGYCGMHYKRWKDHGNPLYEALPAKTYGLKCRFNKCNQSAYWRDGGKRGWCQIHYRRWQRWKNPAICKRKKRGEGCIYKGYKIITVNGRHIFEHRYVMEKFMGRKLNPKEIIHHRNGNPLDNRIKNLELTTQSIHSLYHNKYRYSYLDIACDQCKKLFRTSSWRIRRSQHQFCSKKCASMARRIGGINHIKHYLSLTLSQQGHS